MKKDLYTIKSNLHSYTHLILLNPGEHAIEKEQSAYQSFSLWEGLNLTLRVYNHASVEHALFVFLKRFPFQFNL